MFMYHYVNILHSTLILYRSILNSISKKNKKKTLKVILGIPISLINIFVTNPFPFLLHRRIFPQYTAQCTLIRKTQNMNIEHLIPYKKGFFTGTLEMIFIYESTMM
jgi:hypothetical protein